MWKSMYDILYYIKQKLMGILRSLMRHLTHSWNMYSDISLQTEFLGGRSKNVMKIWDSTVVNAI